MSARRYLVELGGAIAAYSVLLVASILVTNANPDAPWRFAVALVPMLPAAAVPFVVIRQLRRMDELQRTVQLEALGFAFAGTAVLTFGYGFLQNVGAPAVSWFAVWPMMAVLWLVGLGVATRRYR